MRDTPEEIEICGRVAACHFAGKVALTPAA